MHSSEIEALFSTVVTRQEESLYVYTRYEEVLDEYIRYDIKKFFNITVNEYLDLTTYSRVMYNKVAIANIAKLQAELANIQNTQKNDLERIKNPGGGTYGEY